MDKINELPLNEKKAIELRYLGRGNLEISKEIDVPEGTVNNWFREDGKLTILSIEYNTEMNSKRQDNMEKKFLMDDDAWAVLGTNMITKVAKKIQDKDWEPEKFGDMIKAYAEVWRTQRVMRGLPTAHDKTDISQTNLNLNQEDIIARLGLTAEDFLEENYGETLRKISEYIGDTEA